MRSGTAERFASQWRQALRKIVLFLPEKAIGTSPYDWLIGELLDRSSTHRVLSEAGWYVLPNGDHYAVEKDQMMPNAVIAGYLSISEARRSEIMSRTPCNPCGELP